MQTPGNKWLWMERLELFSRYPQPYRIDRRIEAGKPTLSARYKAAEAITSTATISIAAHPLPTKVPYGGTKHGKSARKYQNRDG